MISMCVDRRARLLVVGAHAVAAHGHPRLTRELDVWVADDLRNVASIADVLDASRLGPPTTLAQEFAAGVTEVHLGQPPDRIDIRTTMDGVDFRSCWHRREQLLLGSLTVPFIGLTDLVQNKLTTLRHQDLADVGALRQCGAWTHPDRT